MFALIYGKKRKNWRNKKYCNYDKDYSLRHFYHCFPCSAGDDRRKVPLKRFPAASYTFFFHWSYNSPVILSTHSWMSEKLINFN